MQLQKLTINDMQIIAKLRGGKCLSTDYANAHTLLLWECAAGHQWQATPTTIKHGSHWCPHCAGEWSLTLQDMNLLAQERGGKCLSEVYTNSKTKLLWQCAKGHTWKATPSSIQSGKWCPVCAGKLPLTLRAMAELANRRGGKCLSNQYTNARSKLTWQCTERHTWEATPSDIKQGNWCPTCAGNKKLTLAKMQLLALHHHGKCLSTVYTNSKTNLLRQCDLLEAPDTSAQEEQKEEVATLLQFLSYEERGVIEQRYQFVLKQSTA